MEQINLYDFIFNINEFAIFLVSESLVLSEERVYKASYIFGRLYLRTFRASTLLSHLVSDRGFSVKVGISFFKTCQRLVDAEKKT